MLGVARVGTAVNKTSMSITLVCGSNAEGEALPIHVVFSSDSQEENYQVDARWLAEFPRVRASFGHDDEEELCAQVTVNERGGTYGRVLHHSLSCYTERMYPNAADLVGRHALYTIDGGPGRLAEGMLADCRARGVYTCGFWPRLATWIHVGSQNLTTDKKIPVAPQWHPLPLHDGHYGVLVPLLSEALPHKLSMTASSLFD
jgi:hypothetical protein